MHIRAGIGYLLRRAATLEHITVFDANDVAMHQVTVKAGDNLSKMSRPGQTLNYRKASIQ